MPARPPPFAALRARLLGGPDRPPAAHLLVVAIGDSVTLGLATNPALLHARTYHARLRAALERDYPRTAWSMVNAGVNGDSSAGGRRRFRRDVLDRRPDLALIAFGLNDSGRGREGVPGFARDLGAMVRRAQARGTAVILLTPNAMATHDNGHVDPRYRHALRPFIARQTGGMLGDYAAAIRRVGAACGAPVADVYAAWERRARRGRDMTAHLANGLNHPDAYGHRLAAETVRRALRRALAEAGTGAAPARPGRGTTVP